MNRILFEKVGDGIYISHLDVMRLFQRAFKRGGLHLKHSQGFSPRALVSVALPLSLGTESVCEIMDYELVDQVLPPEEIRDRLNATLPRGIRVLEVYESDVKVKHLTHLDCTVTLEYDGGIPAEAPDTIRALFARESLPVTKKGKNGPTEQDIIPRIVSCAVEPVSEQELEIRARICAQNPSLNPAQLVAASERYASEVKPDFARIRRDEVRAEDGSVFR